jgi:hypothetical protein
MRGCCFRQRQCYYLALALPATGGGLEGKVGHRGVLQDVDVRTWALRYPLLRIKIESLECAKAGLPYSSMRSSPAENSPILEKRSVLEEWKSRHSAHCDPGGNALSRPEFGLLYFRESWTAA